MEMGVWTPTLFVINMMFSTGDGAPRALPTAVGVPMVGPIKRQHGSPGISEPI